MNTETYWALRRSGRRYQASVVIAGQPHARRSFPLWTDAKQWARQALKNATRPAFTLSRLDGVTQAKG